MAIRKMEFVKGDELNIRSFPRIENKVIYENLDKLMEDETQLIVKSGKSYWDVTQNPEIFKQAEEFNPNELTGIEKKEMQQATAPVHAYSEQPEAPIDPMSMLYQKTEEEEEEPEYVVRKTYYMSELAVEVIDAYRYVNKTEISEAVRELIINGAPPEILEKAKKNLEMHQASRKKSITKKKKKRIIL
ncbi:MAG: hypothetical protein IJZ42_13600 [Lachnospiraceae bacterium]|nr:hypothetical protein [Lachnospiraceae bacterium]